MKDPSKVRNLHIAPPVPPAVVLACRAVVRERLGR